MPKKYTPETALKLGWIKDLENLIVKHPEQNITQEVFSMTLAELWGVYVYLERIDNGKK